MFGEGGLNEPSAIRFEAATDCLLYRIEKTTFFSHLGATEVLARAVMLKQWVREQLKLISFMTDVTGLRFSKKNGTPTQQMIAEEDEGFQKNLRKKSYARRLERSDANLGGIKYLCRMANRIKS